MANSEVSEAVANTLRQALLLVANRPALAELAHEIRISATRVNEPMTVAIVGTIKAGKSTLTNALLGAELAIVGPLEATYNVNVLSYGTKPGLTVHFKDRTHPPEHRSIDDLEALTLRAKSPSEELDKIDYLEVTCAHEMLKNFRLVDTPGLNSVHGVDSQNSLDFIFAKGKELTEVTLREASKADAILYLFNHGVAAEDRDTLMKYLGAAAGRTTPMNAIGVLTRIDTCWTQYDDPLDGGKLIVDRLMTDPAVTSLLYSIMPACGKLAFGAKTLTEAEFEALEILAKDPEVIDILSDANEFISEYYESDVSVSIRKQLVSHRLGPYGIALACRLISDGIVCGRDQLMDALEKRSGVPQLRERIISHFGKRADLVKAQHIIDSLDDLLARLLHSVSADDAAIVRSVQRMFETLRIQEHAFRELKALKNYYNGHVEFSQSDISELLTVTGERGSSVVNRLGASEDSTIGELRQLALDKIEAWNSDGDSYLTGSSATRDAAVLMLRSYGLILHKINLSIAAVNQTLTLLKSSGEVDRTPLNDDDSRTAAEFSDAMAAFSANRLTLTKREQQELSAWPGVEWSVPGFSPSDLRPSDLQTTIKDMRCRGLRWRQCADDSILSDAITVKSARGITNILERAAYLLETAGRPLLNN